MGHWKLLLSVMHSIWWTGKISDFCSNDMTDFKKKQLWNDSDICTNGRHLFLVVYNMKYSSYFMDNLRSRWHKWRITLCSWCEWRGVLYCLQTYDHKFMLNRISEKSSTFQKSINLYWSSKHIITLKVFPWKSFTYKH